MGLGAHAFWGNPSTGAEFARGVADPWLLARANTGSRVPMQSHITGRRRMGVGWCLEQVPTSPRCPT